MASGNIVSVSWGDHLSFGEGDGRLASVEAVKRRMASWRDELGASRLHWRLHRKHLRGRFHVARGSRHPSRIGVEWDDLEVVPRLARETGLRPYLYVSLFDEGWPLAPLKVRLKSYHNAAHGQHASWQTTFSMQHPEYAVVDREGRQKQLGVLCLAYSEVRSHFRLRFVNLLRGRLFTGLFVCLRSQSRPADFADQFGFNEPVCHEYKERFGVDILTRDFDLWSWRDLCGEYLTLFVQELHADLKLLGLRLAVGTARGDVLGPPLGNTTLRWQEWVERGIIDELVINQDSSRCPSMWHQLWPMHRGYGYVQNYLDGLNLPPLVQHIEKVYAPLMAGKDVQLYVARQWNERSQVEEEAIMSQPAVTGLVFSSFRHDNPGPVAKGDWRF